MIKVNPEKKVSFLDSMVSGAVVARGGSICSYSEKSSFRGEGYGRSNECGPRFIRKF